MFNKNVFTQTDVVADLIKDINEADYKAKMEALKGNQHKIDKNKNNKVDADDFKILRGEKKVNEDQVEEATSVKIPTSTGTRVLGHRYGNAAKTHRDSMADPFAVVKGPGQKDIEDLEKKKVKKEEIDPKKVTTDTLAGVVKGKTANPFAPKKVMIDVAGNVKEEAEDLDEASFDPLKHVKNPSPAVKAAAKDVKRGSYADRAALMKAGGVKDDRGPRGVTQEEVELDEGTMTHITLGKKVKNDEGGHNQDVHYKGKKIGSIDSYKHRTGLRYGGKHDATGDMDAGSRSPEEAVDFVRSSHAEHLKSMKEDTELNERELSKGETAEKERIVKGMKKSLAGFKARYGDKAKSVMYATATKQAKKD